MYYETIQQFGKSLRNLDIILGKAVAHAEARKFDANNFCSLRLAPDMFTFARQVQTATDIAKAAAATLSGKDAPRYEDNEKSMAELRARLQKCITYLGSYTAEDFRGVKPDQKVKIPYPPNKVMLAHEALLQRTIPNFFFHVAAAYMILRQAGVEIGKGDYLGQLNVMDG